jgi:hypothetical protein
MIEYLGVQNPPNLKNFVQPLYLAIAFEPDDEIITRP